MNVMQLLLSRLHFSCQIGQILGSKSLDILIYLGYTTSCQGSSLWAVSYSALVYKVAVQYLIFIQVVLQKERLFMSSLLMNLQFSTALFGSNH
jgi:hypothetical protein